MKKRGMGLLCGLVLTATLLLPACALGEEKWTISSLSGGDFLKTGTITNGTAILGVNCHTETGKLYITEVNARSGDLGDLVIPAKIDEYTIAGFENNAFKYDDASKAQTLTSITLPDTIEEIGVKAFRDCTQLSSIDLSACTKLTQLGADAFYNCTSLASVTLPENLTSIGNFAFQNCQNLKTIYLLSKDPPHLGQLVFQSTNIEKIIIVNGDAEEYQEASGWSEYAAKIIPAYLLTASPASKEWTLTYGSSAPQTFTLTNGGALDTTNIRVSLVGTDADKYFTLDNKSTDSSLAPQGQTSFTVTPKPDLVAGTHQANVQISADNNVALSISLTLNVQASPTYSVILHPNGGAITAGKDVTAYTYGVGAALPTAADVTRDLYTFAGWYASEDLTGSPVAAITPTDAGNKEYWAKWNLIPGELPVFTEPSGSKEVAVHPGDKATLTASATNATVCQWYVNRGDGAGYVPLSGATAMTYTTSPVTLANDGYTYYCEATNPYGTARSAVFTLRVAEAAVTPPQTGDSSHTGLWLALLLLSLGGLFAAGLDARRRHGAR